MYRGDKSYKLDQAVRGEHGLSDDALLSLSLGPSHGRATTPESILIGSGLDGYPAKTFSGGQVVFCEGDDAVDLFWVTRGQLRLCKMLSDGRRAVTGFVFPDEFVDLSFNNRHSVSAEAVTELELRRISHRRFDGILKASPYLRSQASKLIADRLRRLEDHVLVLARLNAEERLARFIVDVYWRSALGEAIVLHMSRSDVADYLGLTAETISRAAASLARRGLIISRAQGHIVDIIKIAELKEIAQL